MSSNPSIDKLYFCHQCNQSVTLSISSTTDPFCPICSGQFLEEIDNTNPNPNDFFPMTTTDPFSSLLPLFFGPPPRSSQTNNAFDPVSFLQNYLQQIQSAGTHVQFVIEDHPLDHGNNNRIPGNFGDYFLGPGLEQLIQQLAENDPNRYGTPPASKSAIDGLPTVKVDKDMLKSEMNQCAVCMDEFEDGGGVKQMPCKHVFHQDCLLPWLELHNSCPVCRFELPTDDVEYESRVQGGQSSGVGGVGGGQGSGDGGQTPRRFNVQLPWPFRRQDDGSGSGSGSGGGGGGGANLETRGEDLD